MTALRRFITNDRKKELCCADIHYFSLLFSWFVALSRTKNRKVRKKNLSINFCISAFSHIALRSKMLIHKITALCFPVVLSFSDKNEKFLSCFVWNLKWGTKKVKQIKESTTNVIKRLMQLFSLCFRQF